MNKSFNTKIIFRRTLSNQEQYAFWSNAIGSIKKIAVSGVARFDDNIDWSIDYSDSNLNEYEAKKHFSQFLEKQRDIIKDFSFYKPLAN